MLKKVISKVIKDTHASGKETMDMILSECLNAVNDLRCAVTLPSTGTRIFRSMGLWWTSQTRHIEKGRACGWFLPSWRRCFVLQRSASRWTRIEMECWFQIGRFREGQKQPRSNATTHLLDNLRFRARLCYRWSSTSMHVRWIIGFPLHANQKFYTSCSRCSDTTRFHRRTYSTCGTVADWAKGGRNSKRVTGTFANNLFVTCEFITIWWWKTHEKTRTFYETSQNPTQITRTEKRKDFQTDKTAKELRTTFPAADLSHASSLRPSYETQEQLERSSKQAVIARKEVERLQDVSHLFQKGHCEHQRNGFLQVRKAGMRKNKKKKVLKKKELAQRASCS